MSYWKCLKSMFLVGALGAAVNASAQVAAPWNVAGSDTLEKVMKDAISAAETAPDGAGGFILTPNQLKYVGGGSGTAETANGNGIQAIAPMSRQYGSAVLTAHPAWAPSLQNVIGVDAVVIVSRQQPSIAKTVAIPSVFDPGQNTMKAVANNTALAFDATLTNAGYSALIQTILSGPDGSGSFKACSDPRRAQAVYDFAQANGVGTIDTFFRRDDNSGTSNVFQDRMNVGRFCNGRGRGVLGSNTLAVGGAFTGSANLNNQDLDPIRRTCLSAPLLNGAARPPIRCTWTATAPATVNGRTVARGDFCTPADNSVSPGCDATGTCPCTHGLVVALSVGDDAANFADVTATIASRVAADTTNKTYGYAGREAVRQSKIGVLTNAPYINNTSYSDAVVQLDQYLLSRRLYLNYASTVTDAGAANGGTARIGFEKTLYNWMTDQTGNNNADGTTGRCNLDPIIAANGFIPCAKTCTATPGPICNQLVSISWGGQPATPTFPAAASTLSNCFPNGTGGAATGWNYGAVTNGGTAAVTCCSDLSSAAAGAACPAAITAGGLSQYTACMNASECASGACSDVLGPGVNMCN
jgi:PBP superfamily domain